MTERVRVHPHGLELAGGEVLPLYAGSMHYWRHAPEEWGPGLDAMRAMGMRLVDTYVPWGEHEIVAGDFDFGERHARLDVAKFVRMCGERGLYVVLRPGPHINAELTWFGLPERLVWTRDCQARSPRDNPVMLPMIPVAFPVPSYASEVFHEETARWFAAVGKELASLRYPDGPIVLLQVDNEGAMYFRDGAYDQDYHPDAIHAFREHLREKYKRVSELRVAWRDDEVQFATAMPPTRFDAKSLDDVPRHLDWMVFHERVLTQAFERMRGALDASGLSGLPTMHNFPMGEAVTALNPSGVGSVLDFVGLDYYHRASEHDVVRRRTTELASRCEGLAQPAYAAEMGAGFPPFFAPIDEKDSLYCLMAAMAYGLRGFNLYMAVERDRWIGAPIDPHGAPRPLADTYRALMAALDKVRFHTLERRAPVRLVVPRALRRLARVTHAFGPATPALFHVLGAGFRESCLEELGEGDARVPNPVVAAEAFVREMERALEARGVPYAWAGGETAEASVRGAKWVVCGSAGGLKPELVSTLRAIAQRGVPVTLGPEVPSRDGGMRKLAEPHDVSGLEIEPLEEMARADELVAQRIDALDLPTIPVEPPTCHATVHEDAAGKASVVFVMNPTDEPQHVKVGLPREVKAIERVFPPSQAAVRAEREGGGFEVPVGAREVHVFTVELR
jgi:beta-galactosidase